MLDTDEVPNRTTSNLSDADPIVEDYMIVNDMDEPGSLNLKTNSMPGLEHRRLDGAADGDSVHDDDEIFLDGGRVQSAMPISPDYELLSVDENNDNSISLASIEVLPVELLQEIASLAATDLDMTRLSIGSSALSSALVSNKTDIWRARFLARYDYPSLLHLEDEFALAYKIRRFVLRKFDISALSNASTDKAEHQLLVINDMILETYNRHKSSVPPPKTSKNLHAMSSPYNSPWIVGFMGCASYGSQKFKHGQANKLFDILHLTLSHLVLNQRSSVLLQLPSSRENYDLTRVYNYNRPFAIMLEKLNDEEKPSSSFKNKRSPKLKSLTPECPRTKYWLDTHTLLHIRNFWQRHIADEVKGIGENTYAAMARNLLAMRMAPLRWEVPLQDCIPLKTKWCGHYSCLHPWPKRRQDLEERQSCAEDWDHIDPMTLDLETSTSNNDGVYWPPLFSTIPIFEGAMPNDSQKRKLHVEYFRGIAPFMELKDRKKHKHSDVSVQQSAQKWHPFLASRVHGFVHDIPEEAVLGRKPRKERFSKFADGEQEKVIPGWKRIAMVIYKPARATLFSILAHAAEDYGGASGTDMTFNTAGIWNDNASVNVSTNQAQPDAGTNTNAAQPANITSSTVGAADATASTNDSPDDAPSDEQVEADFIRRITIRINSVAESYAKLQAENQKPVPEPSPFAPSYVPRPGPKIELPSLFAAKHIRQLEEDFSPAQYMTWDDGTIEYAYAYEGVIIPGGKIMLGRWWRVHGIEGMGPGKEVDPDGAGVEVRSVVQAQSDSSNGDADADDSGSTSRAKCKKRKCKEGSRKSKRQCTSKRNSKLKRKVYGSATEDDDADGGWDEEEQTDDESEEPTQNDEAEYEFVTIVNGEESRAVNATKGLERGPFVFWSI